MYVNKYVSNGAGLTKDEFDDLIINTIAKILFENETRQIVIQSNYYDDDEAPTITIEIDLLGVDK